MDELLAKIWGGVVVCKIETIPPFSAQDKYDIVASWLSKEALKMWSYYMSFDNNTIVAHYPDDLMLKLELSLKEYCDGLTELIEKDYITAIDGILVIVDIVADDDITEFFNTFGGYRNG